MDRFEAFAGLIVDINRCIQRIKEEEMRKFGLRAGHTMCLYQLSQRKDGLTATQLTELCSADKAAISRALRQLADKELVYCNLPENKRSYRTLYYLTDEGERLASAMNERIAHALSTGGFGVSDSERENMYKSLDLIRSNLTNYVDEFER